jgi:hypothetical protein
MVGGAQSVRAVLGLVAAVVGLVVPSWASADAPVIDRYESPDDFVWEACGYPVRIQIEGNATDISFFDDAGALERRIGTGSFRAVLTNVESGPSGESLTINISGPLFAEFNPDGSRVVTTRGPWLLLYRPESLESPTIVPWLFLFEGERVLRVEADGSRSVTWRGRFVDLCAQLAE